MLLSLWKRTSYRRSFYDWILTCRTSFTAPDQAVSELDPSDCFGTEQLHPTPIHTTHPFRFPPSLTTPTSSIELVEPDEQRLMKVAVVGLPNAGKSTLVNQLVGQKLFAVSPKRHTTLHRAMGVFTHGPSQVVLLDTPGLISYREGRKLKVSKQFLTDPARSVMEADTIMVMVDASNKHSRDRLDQNILRVLRANRHLPSVLVLNKVDLLSHKHILLSVAEGLTGTMARQGKRKQIADLTKKLRNRNLPEKVQKIFKSKIQALRSDVDDGCVSEQSSTTQHEIDGQSTDGTEIECKDEWPYFRETFMVSSMSGDGIESLKEYLVDHAPKGEWQHSPCEVTDTPTLDLVEGIVREKLFKYLWKELPYVITQNNVLWEHTDNSLCVYQNINCKTDKQVSIVIGPGGRTIQAITSEAKEAIETLLNTPVDLTLRVRTQNK